MLFKYIAGVIKDGISGIITGALNPDSCSVKLKGRIALLFELGRFRNVKLKNFSSGMYARLRLSLQRRLSPDQRCWGIISRVQILHIPL
jgi:hypothetical protein